MEISLETLVIDFDLVFTLLLTSHKIHSGTMYMNMSLWHSVFCEFRRTMGQNVTSLLI